MPQRVSCFFHVGNQLLAFCSTFDQVVVCDGVHAERPVPVSPLHLHSASVVDGAVEVRVLGCAPGRRVRLHASASHFLWAAGLLPALAPATDPAASATGDKTVPKLLSQYLNSRTVGFAWLSPSTRLYIQLRLQHTALHLLYLRPPARPPLTLRHLPSPWPFFDCRCHAICHISVCMTVVVPRGLPIFTV